MLGQQILVGMILARKLGIFALPQAATATYYHEVQELDAFSPRSRRTGGPLARLPPQQAARQPGEEVLRARRDGKTVSSTREVYYFFHLGNPQLGSPRNYRACLVGMPFPCLFLLTRSFFFLFRTKYPARCFGGRRPWIAGCSSLQRLGMT